MIVTDALNSTMTMYMFLQISIALCVVAHLMCFIYLHRIKNRTATKIDIARLAISLQLRLLSMAFGISAFVTVCVIELFK